MGQSVFDHIPPILQGHFLLHFYAAVHYVIHYTRRLNGIVDKELDETLEQFPFLKKYLAEIHRFLPEGLGWDQSAAWWEREVTSWERGIGEHLPLRAVSEVTGAGFPSRIALVIAGLVDEDSRFGTLFTHLQAPLNYRRPCLETVGQIIADKDGSSSMASWNVCRPLLTGLIEVPNRDAPRSEWVLRVPALLWDVIRGTAETHGTSWCQMHRSEEYPFIPELIFPQDFLRRLENVAALVTNGRVRAIILRGMQGSERLDVLGAIARDLGRGVIEAQPALGRTKDENDLNVPQRELLGPLCTLAHCIPIFTHDLGPGETVDVYDLPGYSGPIGVLLGLEGGLRGPLAEQALTLTIPMPGVTERMRHWQKTLDGHRESDLEEIGKRFQIPGGYIRQAGRIAITQMALDQRAKVNADDIRTACRALNRQLLDSLATRLEVEGTWNELVVSDPVAIKLHEVELRCRHREQLVEHLGPAFRSATNRGVRALFTGSSGTGKTYAAKILASELGMDLYRVDLSAVVNKYIGETEKNLHRVLSRAEELDVILLLDEGDSLLGNRTEVKSSNDRYANLETNYLLQRLENYQGIVLVTTNASQHIDRAFQRRMDVLVNFVAPQAEERLRIWQLHLPSNHAVDVLYLEEIATRFVATGGQIRNAALHATLLALEDGSYVVRRIHVNVAIESEYRKAGAVYPVIENGVANDRHTGMAVFLDMLSN